MRDNMPDLYNPGIDVAPMRRLMEKWYRISERLAENEARITRLKVNGSDDRWMKTCKRNRTYQRRRKQRLEFYIVDYVERKKWQANFSTDEAPATPSASTPEGSPPSSPPPTRTPESSAP